MGTVPDRHELDTVTVALSAREPTLGPLDGDIAYLPVTRFNLMMDAGESTRSTHLRRRHLPSSPEYDDYWRSRLAIFERVCLPSVLNLAPRPDAWFIAFGTMEPPYIQELLERLRAYPWIVPYVRRGGDPLNAPPLPTLLAQTANSLGKRYICTSRLDSDDSLNRQYVYALDRAIAQLTKQGLGDRQQSLDFLYGLIDRSGEFSVYLRGSSMFQSIYTPVSQAIGPYPVAHDRIRQRMPLVEIITNLPMWLYHRYDESIDVASAVPASLLTLPDPAQYLPMFGLSPEPADARPV